MQLWPIMERDLKPPRTVHHSVPSLERSTQLRAYPAKTAHILCLGILWTGHLLAQTDPRRPERTPEVAQTGPSGIITTVAGDGFSGDSGNGGLATNAPLLDPWGVAVDNKGNIYVTDGLNQVVRKVSASTGDISIYAGVLGEPGYSGDEGSAISAKLDDPFALAVDSAGNLYIADFNNDAVRMVSASTGVITTIAGNGEGVYDGHTRSCPTYTSGALATKTGLCGPISVAVDSKSNLYIGSNAGFVYKVTKTTGVITTLAGGGRSQSGEWSDVPAVGANIGEPYALAVDGGGNVYIANTPYCMVQKVAASTGELTMIAGSITSYGYPYCALAGDGGPATSAGIGNGIFGLAVDGAGDLFIADSFNGVIRMVEKSNGNIYTVAGRYNRLGDNQGGAIYGYTGDGGPAASALLDYPAGLAVDGTGNLYLADNDYDVVRKVSNAIVAPTQSPAFGTAGGEITPPASVSLSAPKGATIYYSTDGSVPSTSSTKYTGPITISDTTLVTAFATYAGQPNSAASTQLYAFVGPPSFNPPAQGFTGSIKVTITDVNPKAQIWYTTDGTTPYANSGTSQLYTGPITLTKTTSLSANAFTSATSAGGNVYLFCDCNIISAAYGVKGKPSATTEPATQISGASAVLNGKLYTGEEQSTYWFAYGTTSSNLNQKACSQSFPADGVATSLNCFVSLSSNRTYYFQFVATNSSGTSKGAVLSFKTQ